MNQQLRIFIPLLTLALFAAGVSACDPKKKEEVKASEVTLSVSELQEAFLSQKNCSNTLSIPTKGASVKNSAVMRCRVYDTAALIEIGYSTWKMTESLAYHLARVEGYGLEERNIVSALSSQSALGGIDFENGEGIEKPDAIQSHFDYLMAVKKGSASFVGRGSFEKLLQIELAPTDLEAEEASCRIAYAESDEIRRIQRAFELRTLANLVRSGKVNSAADLASFRLGEFNLQELDYLIGNLQMLAKPYVLIRKMSQKVSSNFARSTQIAAFDKSLHIKSKLNCLLLTVLEDEALDQSLREGVIKGLNVKISGENAGSGELVHIQSVPVAAADSQWDRFTHVLEFPSEVIRDLNSFSAQEIRDALIDASQKK